MKKIILFLMSVVFMSITVYAHDLSQIDVNLPCTNVNVIKDILTKNLTYSDYGGVYTAIDGLHIVPTDITLIEREIARTEIEMQCQELPVTLDNQAKYSMQELMDANDKISALPEMVNINSSYIRTKPNGIIVVAYEWTEELKQIVRKTAGIDNIIFEMQEAKQILPEKNYSLLPIRESYADEKEYLTQPLDEQTQLKILAGKLWINRKKFYISSIDVGNIPITITVEKLTEKKEVAIREFAGIYAENIQILSTDEDVLSERLPFSYRLRELMIFPEQNYITYDGMLFVIKNKPYVKNGYLMLPMRDIYGILEEVSDSLIKYTITWLGGEEELVELRSGQNAMPVQISMRDNLLIFPKSIYKTPGVQMIEGKAELIQNTIFVPYSFENTSSFLLPKPKDKWDTEVQILTLWR